MNALLATLLGGFLAIAGGVVGAMATGRGEFSRWRRDAQLRAATELLSSLQDLVRRMIDIAYLSDKPPRGDPGPTSSAYRDATIKWNSSIYAALLVSPPNTVTLVQALDGEADRLIDVAIARQWARDDFRDERRVLGRLAADYLNSMRTATGWPPIALESIWGWDGTSFSSASTAAERTGLRQPGLAAPGTSASETGLGEHAS